MVVVCGCGVWLYVVVCVVVCGCTWFYVVCALLVHQETKLGASGSKSGIPRKLLALDLRQLNHAKMNLDFR
jgi:hypothetical protein